MNTTQYNSRTADKFVMRLPEGLRDQIDAAAVADDRSMNSVIVQAVKQYLDAQNRQELLLNALASAARTTEDSSVVSEQLHIDDRVQLVANAKRYEWLRNPERSIDGTRSEGNIETAVDGQIVFGIELDKSIDDAIRLACLEEQHPCAD